MGAADSDGDKPVPRGIEVQLRNGIVRRYQDSYDVHQRSAGGGNGWELLRTEYTWRYDDWGIVLITVTTTRWEHVGPPDEDKPVPVPSPDHEPVGVSREDLAMFRVGEVSRLERYTVLGPDWQPSYEGATDFPDES